MWLLIDILVLSLCLAIGIKLARWPATRLAAVAAAVILGILYWQGVIPPILYGIKTLACGYCAFYAYQLRERISGAVQIP